MARYSCFPSRFSLLRTVVFLTGCSLGLSPAVLAQSVKSAPSQSPQTAASSGSTVQAPATPKPNALTTFLVAPAVSVSGSPSSVAVGDLNGDGNLDLVLANFDAGKISVLLGQGNGQFTAPVDYPVGKQPAFVLVGDVNGDGKLDVVVCNKADGTLSVLLGNGDGTLQSPATYRTVPDPVYVVMSDLNGDGKPDLAVAGNASNTIAVLLNAGTGDFSQAVPYNIGRSPRSLAVADFDSDGHPDLASANADGTVSILLGRGDGSFRAISSLNVAPVPLSSVVSGDFNGDGKPDLAVTQAGTKLLTVLLGRGDGTFQAGSPYTVGSNPASAVVVDVNNDNISDLVTANQAGNTFSVLLGNGDGTFKRSLDFTAGNSPRALAAGDFNGDGRADLAIVNFSDHTISIPLGNGDGTFQAARAYNVDLDRKSVAAGDLEGDGKPDLVVTNFCGTDATCASNGTVSVLLAVGDGTYKFAASYPLGAGPLSVALADVNGDKKLDLIAVNRGDKSVSVLLGNGDGTFQSALTYPAGNSPVSVAVGDFNKDGKPDLAIAGDCGSSTCSQPGEVNILLGNGDGSFQSAATYAVGYSPSSIFAGDVNGDGNLDLMVANACGKDSSCQSNGTATVLIGDGKGGFAAGTDVKLGNSPSAVTLGDLNGDGAPDLVAAYRADNKVGVLLGSGDGTFKSQVTYQVGTAPSAVVVVDFNGDGKRDVAVANFQDSKVSVLFGNGDGTLQPAVHYPVGVGPESLVAIDPNNTGHADLITANGNGGLTPQGSDVTVLRNLAAPLLLTPVFTNLTPSQMITYGTASITLSGKLCAGPQCVPKGEQVTITIQGQPPQTATISDNTGDFSTTYPTNTIPVGTYTITYSYAGDMMFNPASDSSTMLTVNPVTPVFSNPTASQTITYGTASITLSGTICAPSGPPLCPPQGEQVTITIQGQPPQTATISDNTGDFSTTYPTGTIPASNTPYTITYSYPGDPNFGPATDSTTTLTVNQATTTTTITDVEPPSPSSYGTAVTFTAQVTGQNGGSPTGMVTIQDITSGTPVTICTGTLSPLSKLASGRQANGKQSKRSPGNGSTASCTTAANNPLTAGTHMIQAMYNGDTNYQTSTSTPPISYTVNLATPVFSNLTPSQMITYGTASITLSGTICAPGGVCPPMGEQVTITIQGQPPQTATISDNTGDFSTTYPTGTIPAGTYTITYNYPGDSNFNPASDSSTMLTVTQATTTTTITDVEPPSPSSYGTAVTFTAQVTGQNGGNPTGTVTLQDITSGTPVTICTGTLSPLSKPTSGKQSKRSLQGNGSTATCMTDPNNPLTAGTHSIQAMYNGDNNYQTSTSTPPISYTVTQATTATTITDVEPPSPSSYGTAVTFTAQVTGQNGGNPTGTVTIQDITSGTPVTICTGTLSPLSKPASSKQSKRSPQGNGSTASCTTAANNPLTAGTHSIQAMYNGDSNYQTSTSMPPTSYTVTQATPVFSNLTAYTISYGTASITVSGTICAPGGVCPPQGEQVTITIQGQPPQTATISDNTGDFSTSYPTGMIPVGSYPIMYSYPGDSNFMPASTTGPSLTVQQATTTTTITDVEPPSPSTYGTAVTFTAQVTGQNGGSPTGTVTIQDITTGIAVTICTGTLSPLSKPASGKQSKRSPQGNGSMASCTTAANNPLMGGTHSIQAMYNGDPNYQTSTSTPPISYTVNKATPTVTVMSDNNPSTYGQTVDFTATVTGPNGGAAPGGTVTFTDNGNQIATCITVQVTKGNSNSSTAGCTTSVGNNNLLMGGSHTIVANFNDDGNYQPASGTLAPSQVVNRLAATVTVASDNNPSIYGQTIDFTATVTGASGGAAPGGKVTFTDNGNQIATCVMVGVTKGNSNSSTAVCTTSAANQNLLLAGSHTIVANYSDDTDYSPGSGTLAPNQVVNKATPTSSIASNLPTSVLGQSVTFTASITGVSGGVSPTGSVTFNSNGVSIPGCSGVSVGNGQPTCTTTTLAFGTDTITGVYSGDSNYTGAQPSLVQTVQDFVIEAQPSSATVIQSYNNTNEPFYAQALATTLMPRGTFGYNGTVNLTCTVTGLTCMVLPDCTGSTANICISPASFVMGNGNATIVVSTAASTPIGTYMVTITGQDTADGGTPNTTALSVTVVDNTVTVTVVPGFTGTTIANFVGTQSVNLTAFACTKITGTGLPAGGSDPSSIGISCTFNPETGTLSTDPTNPTKITVTVLTKASGSTTTRRQTRERILAALWLGMPGIVLIGSLRLRNLSRKRILQILGTVLLLIALMQGIGCGGGFTPPPSPVTPAGAYNLLVVGYSNGTQVTSAVVPVIVTH